MTDEILQINNSTRRIWLVWAALIFFTVSAWAVSHTALSQHISRPVEICIVIAAAAIKIRLIVRDYMAIRFAPPALRLCLDLWLVGLTLMLGGFYFGLIRL
jgi:hypothetical protein